MVTMVALFNILSIVHRAQ